MIFNQSQNIHILKEIYGRMKWKKMAIDKPKRTSKTSKKAQDNAIRNEKLLKKARMYLGNIIKVCLSNVYEHFFMKY